MRIQTQTQGFDLTDSIKEHVDQQLCFHLANFESAVMSVDVYLRDINGPKGGPDKKVLLRIHLSTGSTVAIERTRSDLYAAFTHAARQSKRAVRRSLGKYRHMEKLAARELRQNPVA